MEFESHLATKDLLTAVCSATGKPAPNITWLIDEDLYEPPEIHYIQNPNGTVTVANRCTFSASHLHNLACLLDHPQGRKVKTLTGKIGKNSLCLHGGVKLVVRGTLESSISSQPHGKESTIVVCAIANCLAVIQTVIGMCNCGSAVCLNVGLSRDLSWECRLMWDEDFLI